MQVITIGTPEFQQVIAEATAIGYVRGREEANAEVKQDPEEIVSFDDLSIELYSLRHPQLLAKYAKNNNVQIWNDPKNLRKNGIKRKDIPKLFKTVI